MVALRFQDFRGRLPKLHPTSLPPGYAQVATACELIGGTLRAHRGAKLAASLPAGSNVVGWIDGDWRGFADPTARIVPGPVATDRFYITSATDVPRVRRFTGSTFDRQLKLPPPATAASRSVTGTFDINNYESIAFALTYVTDLGEESQPSPLGSIVKYSPGQAVTLTATDTPPAGRGVTGRRVYRTVTDFSGNAVLHYVGQTGAGAGATFTYTLGGDPVQEPIPSMDYDQPRDDLLGLTAMANGMMAAFSGATLCFCEPYIPHAWPRKYELVMDAPIVGLVSFGQSLAVLTTRAPHIVGGSHPSVMVAERWEESLPCVSRYSIVDTGNAALYASHEGLVEISPAGPRVITRGLFDFGTWAAIRPSAIRSAVVHDGRYKFISDPDDGLPNGGIIDLTGEEPFFIAESIDACQLYVRPSNGRLYTLADDDAGGSRPLMEFDAEGEADVPYLWRSGVVSLPQLTNFGWAYLDCDGGTSAATVNLLGGRSGTTLLASFSAERTPVRLPAGRLEQQFSIEITGSATVRSVSFGGDPSELLG